MPLLQILQQVIFYDVHTSSGAAAAKLMAMHYHMACAQTRVDAGYSVMPINMKNKPLITMLSSIACGTSRLPPFCQMFAPPAGSVT